MFFWVPLPGAESGSIILFVLCNVCRFIQIQIQGAFQDVSNLTPYPLPQFVPTTPDQLSTGRRLTTNVSVPGNIHRMQYRSFWKDVLKPSKMVMDTIENGYSLPFMSIPPPSFEKNNKSARDGMPFVRQEVKRLEKLGCIERVVHRPRCVLPLSSVFSKKKRLVVDGSRCLNPYLQHRRVRLQDLQDILDIVKKGMWFFWMTLIAVTGI